MKTCLLSMLIWTGVSVFGCTAPPRTSVRVPNGSPTFALMDFAAPPSLAPISPGWHQRTFVRHPPMDISFMEKDGYDTIRLSTHDSASMLSRWVDVALDAYPILSWDWNIEQPIESEEDERTTAGDDHPARIFLKFESAAGETHAMEIIWGNRTLHRGDWKHLDFLGFFSFPHYVARGGDENAHRWHHERVRLDELYSTLWGDPGGAHLVELALFCDSDETGAQSVAYFANLNAETRP